MTRLLKRFVLAACLAILAAGFMPRTFRAQDARQLLVAHARIFPEIGPGVRALKRDAAGHYFVLASPAGVIAIFSAEGKRIGQIPNANSHGAIIRYAVDIDIDASGHLLVADRGANAVDIFSADGTLISKISVAAPISVVALAENQFAVVKLESEKLISIYDQSGKVIRRFGQPDAPQKSTDPAASGRDRNLGRAAGDPAGNIYFAFAYVADPTMRKYDVYGYSAWEIALSSEEFAPRDSNGLLHDYVTLGRREAPAAKPVINAFGVDPANQEVWAAIGDALLHFDKDGNRLATFRVESSAGAQLEPDAILIEQNRIVLAADPIGVFDFARPADSTIKQRAR